MPCCGVLPLFTSTEGGYCQVTKEAHWQKNMCNRWDVHVQSQAPILLCLSFGFSSHPSDDPSYYTVRISRKLEIFCFFFVTIFKSLYDKVKQQCVPKNCRSSPPREKFPCLLSQMKDIVFLFDCRRWWKWRQHDSGSGCWSGDWGKSKINIFIIYTPECGEMFSCLWLQCDSYPSLRNHQHSPRPRNM